MPFFFTMKPLVEEVCHTPKAMFFLHFDYKATKRTIVLTRQDSAKRIQTTGMLFMKRVQPALVTSYIVKFTIREAALSQGNLVTKKQESFEKLQQ